MTDPKLAKAMKAPTTPRRIRGAIDKLAVLFFVLRQEYILGFDHTQQMVQITGTDRQT